MMPYLTTEWGNPSSSYKFGSKLKGVIETAREEATDHREQTEQATKPNAAIVAHLKEFECGN